MLKRLARALREAGALLAIICAGGYLAVYLLTFVQHGVIKHVIPGEVTKGVWSSGTLYLSAAGDFDDRPTCDITPRGNGKGKWRAVTLPPESSGRNPDLDGRVVRRWFSGPADVQCTGPVYLSSQPWPVGYWIAEHGWFNLLVPLVGGLGYVILPNGSWPIRLTRRIQGALKRLRNRLQQNKPLH